MTRTITITLYRPPGRPLHAEARAGSLAEAELDLRLFMADADDDDLSAEALAQWQVELRAHRALVQWFKTGQRPAWKDGLEQMHARERE